MGMSRSPHPASALVDGLGEADLIVLLSHDSDPFNRWEAGQRLAMSRLLAAARSEAETPLDAAFVEAMRDVLRNPALDIRAPKSVRRLPPPPGCLQAFGERRRDRSAT